MLKPGGLKGLLIQMNCLIVLCYTNEISLQGSVLLQYRFSILFSPTALLIQQEKEKTVICYFYHSQGSFIEEQNSVQNVWNYLRMWTEGEASGVIYSCTGTLCRHQKKKKKKRTTWRTKYIFFNPEQGYCEINISISYYIIFVWASCGLNRCA